MPPSATERELRGVVGDRELAPVEIPRRATEAGLEPYAAAIGSIRLGSLFLTLPTRWLTGQHVMPSAG
jgi:hypothetical protein